MVFEQRPIFFLVRWCETLYTLNNPVSYRFDHLNMNHLEMNLERNGGDIFFYEKQAIRAAGRQGSRAAEQSTGFNKLRNPYCLTKQSF